MYVFQNMGTVGVGFSVWFLERPQKLNTKFKTFCFKQILFCQKSVFFSKIVRPRALFADVIILDLQGLTFLFPLFDAPMTVGNVEYEFIETQFLPQIFDGQTRIFSNYNRI